MTANRKVREFSNFVSWKKKCDIAQFIISYLVLATVGYIDKFSKRRVILPITSIWNNGSYAYGKTVTKDIAKV